MSSLSVIPNKFNNFYGSQANSFSTFWKNSKVVASAIRDVETLANHTPNTSYVYYEIPNCAKLIHIDSRQVLSRKVVINDWDSWKDNTLEKNLLNDAIESTLVFDGRIFETLIDPRRAMSIIREVCGKLKKHIYIVTSEMGVGAVRSWDENQFERFIEGMGLSVCDKISNNHVLKIEYNSVFWTTQALHFGLPQALFSAEVLLLVTEDADVAVSGGIGTYVRNIKKIRSDVCSAVLNFITDRRNSSDQTITYGNLFLSDQVNYQIYDDAIIEFVRSILIYGSKIHTIEIQDWQSVGFRVVQARQTGMLPHQIRLELVCHGNYDHIKYIESSQASSAYSIEELNHAIRSDYIFQNVDRAVFPSHYLLGLLRNEYGYNIPNAHVRRNPFVIMPEAEDDREELFGPITQIVFIGKYNKIKGWIDFCDAIERLAELSQLSGITKIVTICQGEKDERRLTKLRKISNTSVEGIELSNSELLKFIKHEKNKSIFILPYKGDNYPYGVIEVIAQGARLVTYAAGGIPEIISNSEYLDTFVSQPSFEQLALRIICILRANSINIRELVRDTTNEFRLAQKEIVDQYRKEWPRPASLEIQRSRRESIIDVVTPVFNTSLQYIEELADSIYASHVRPREWIIVDDGSDISYSSSLQMWCGLQDGSVTVKYVRQQNRGLAGARNRGLWESTADLVLFVDADDVIRPHALGRLIDCLELTGHCVTGGFCTLSASPRTEQVVTTKNAVGFVSPLGVAEAGPLGLFVNVFPPGSLFLVRANEMRNLGGWNESDFGTWEDWEFYLRLASLGVKFSLVPDCLFVYRQHKSNMTIKENVFWGRRRLVKGQRYLNQREMEIIVGYGLGSHFQRNDDVFGQISPLEMELIGLKRKVFSRRMIALWPEPLRKVFLWVLMRLGYIMVREKE